MTEQRSSGPFPCVEEVQIGKKRGIFCVPIIWEYVEVAVIFLVKTELKCAVGIFF
jgi:hypothetical protein